MEDEPKLSKDLCRKIFLKSFDDLEVCYKNLLLKIHDAYFLLEYKLVE